MKRTILNLVLASLLISMAQIVVAATQPDDHLNAVVADVNGTKLTIADFQAYIKMRQKNPNELNHNQRQKIFDEYINRELLYQEAINKGLINKPRVKADIENQRRNIVVSHALKELMQIAPNENDMQSEYKKVVLALGKEYKARHILVKTELKAKQIIAKLNKGENFIQLATQHSIDTSGKKGGELNWFSRQQMVQPFSMATQKLSNGSYTRTPVKTRFGWHIIRLDGTRTIPPPSYEEMKEKIIISINNRRISTYIANLRQQSSIALGKIEIPANKTASTK